MLHVTRKKIAQHVTLHDFTLNACLDCDTAFDSNSHVILATHHRPG